MSLGDLGRWIFDLVIAAKVFSMLNGTFQSQYGYLCHVRVSRCLWIPAKIHSRKHIISIWVLIAWILIQRDKVGGFTAEQSLALWAHFCICQVQLWVYSIQAADNFHGTFSLASFPVPGGSLVIHFLSFRVKMILDCLIFCYTVLKLIINMWLIHTSALNLEALTLKNFSAFLWWGLFCCHTVNKMNSLAHVDRAV